MWLGRLLFQVPRLSISSRAQAALARARPTQISITSRNPLTNAWLIEALISAVVCESRPAPRWRGLTHEVFELHAWRMAPSMG